MYRVRQMVIYCPWLTCALAETQVPRQKQLHLPFVWKRTNKFLAENNRNVCKKLESLSLASKKPTKQTHHMLNTNPQKKQTRPNQSTTPKDQNQAVCREILRITREMLIFLSFLIFNKMLQAPSMVCLETQVLIASNEITSILNRKIVIM